MARHVVTISTAGAISRPGEASSAALEAAIAVLVADADTPTEAHVTDANDALTAYLAANAAEIAGQVTISYDTTATQNQIKEGARALLRQIEGIA